MEVKFWLKAQKRYHTSSSRNYFFLNVTVRIRFRGITNEVKRSEMSIYLAGGRLYV
jgi:hypothetical protein